ncbi:MAG: 50S ribosomal protein L10 [Candidatus Omnitrophica bacterium 4484_70.2]|nr:MAG: 50S ribosomal protein L10 [Candidatus Omnitrophica bacterium 4484_70.2]
MKERVGLLIRKKLIEEIEKSLEGSSACLFVGFSKIKASQMNVLRGELRRSNSALHIFKNSLIKRAFTNLKKEIDKSFLEGLTGLVFVQSVDIAKVCKLLVDFSKETENTFYLKGGFLEERRLTKEEILELAKLPSYEVLVGMAINAFISPLTGFLASINQIILKFLWLVEEIKKKKEGG